MPDKVKERLDVLLVKRGFAESRTKASSLIGAGLVFVDDKLADKSGHYYNFNTNVKIKGNNCPFCSRGGLKLQKALDYFKISVDEKICMDVGASTGGFTDCLLQRGAMKVYAVDVGYGQLDWKLRNNAKVVVLERTNIRTLSPDLISEQLDVLVVDTSFISLKLVVPACLPFLSDYSEIIVLVKPQFEVGKRDVGKGGIVRDSKLHQKTLDDLAFFFNNELNLSVVGHIESPIKGAKGNVEFLMLLIKLPVNQR